MLGGLLRVAPRPRTGDRDPARERPPPQHAAAAVHDRRADVGQGANLVQFPATGAQPGEHVLHHVLGGGAVADQKQRQPDQIRVILAENTFGIKPLASSSRLQPARLAAAGLAAGLRWRAERAGLCIVHITSTHDCRIGCPPPGNSRPCEVPPTTGTAKPPKHSPAERP